ELVVLWIAACRNPLPNGNQLGAGEEARQGCCETSGSNGSDVRPAQNLHQLPFGRVRFQQSAVLFDPADDEKRQRILFEDGANEDVGVDDKSHPERDCPSERACSIRRSMSSSLRPAAITSRRDSCRALVSQLSGWIITVTRRSRDTPSRFRT